MASEVPTHVSDALVTCRFFTFKRFFTLEVQKMQLITNVSIKLYVKFSLIACCEKLNFKGHNWPKNPLS